MHSTILHCGSYSNTACTQAKMMMEQSHKLGAKSNQIMQESISEHCVMDSVIL